MTGGAECHEPGTIKTILKFVLKKFFISIELSEKKWPFYSKQ